MNLSLYMCRGSWVLTEQFPLGEYMRIKKWQGILIRTFTHSYQVVTKASFINSDLRGYRWAEVSGYLKTITLAPNWAPFLKLQEQTLQSVQFYKNFVIIVLLFNIFCWYLWFGYENPYRILCLNIWSQAGDVIFRRMWPSKSLGLLGGSEMLCINLGVCILASLPVRSLLPGLRCEQAALYFCHHAFMIRMRYVPPNKEPVNPFSLKLLLVRYLVKAVRWVSGTHGHLKWKLLFPWKLSYAIWCFAEANTSERMLKKIHKRMVCWNRQVRGHVIFRKI